MIRPLFRPTEFALLLGPLVWVFTGLTLIGWEPERGLPASTLTVGLLFCGTLVLAHGGLSLARCRGDQLLLPLAAMLVALGLVLVQRLAGPELALRQSLWLLLGVGVLLLALFATTDPSWLRRYKYTWALLGLALLAASLVLGTAPSPGAPRLWLNLAGLSFQPSELLKVLLVIFFAAYLDQYQEILSRGRYRLGGLSLPPLPYLLPLGIMWGLSLLLLFVQRDLGAALLFFGIFLALLYVASQRAIYLLGGGMAFGVGVALTYRFIDVVQRRIAIWLDPWADAPGSAYQIVQGLIALASGGVVGRGLGYGQPTSIPAVHTDYMLGALGEEMGLLGSFALLALYLLFVYRGYRIALGATTGFQQLLAAGLTTVIALQTLVILGGNLRLIPLTGITLPFVSYGGSSLVANLLILGLLLRISDRTEAARLIRSREAPRLDEGQAESSPPSPASPPR